MVAGGSTLTIRRNEIFWNESGIYIDYLAEESTVTIEDNLIADNYYGIEFNAVDESTVTIAGNTIGEEWGDPLDGNYDGGIYFGYVYGSTVTIGGDTPDEGNIIVGNGLNEGSDGGIYVENLEASSLEILNNDILGNYADGVYVSVLDEESTVDIHYNSIAGNDGGYGVSNDSAYTIDATYNYWGDATGADPDTQANNPHLAAAAGDAVTDNVDFTPWYATATTTSSTQYVSVDHTPSSIIAYSDTIQDAIDAALADDTITVAAGTYVEQVYIDKNLTLLGAPGAIIQMPDGELDVEEVTYDVLAKTGTGYEGEWPATTGGDTKIRKFTAVVMVEDADVTIDGFVVDGNFGVDADAYNASAKLVGIAYGNADGTISNNEITNCREEEFDHFNNGNAIYLVGGTVNAVVVDNNDLHDYEWMGLVIDGLLTATVTENSITGWGVANYVDGFPQNGIQVSRGATATIESNTITDNLGEEGGTPYYSAGVIFVLDAEGTISNNDISNNRVGIGFGSTDMGLVVAHYNNISGNTLWGALADDGATGTLDATNNWWGHSSGPGEVGSGSGDTVSAGVDYEPWLLTEEALTDVSLRYNMTLALKPGWSIVSSALELSKCSIVDSVGLVLTYDGDTGWTEVAAPDPITPVFIKTESGGGIGFTAAKDSMGIFTTQLEVGWNLIGVPFTGMPSGLLTRAVLSPLRFGANNEVALATLAYQGNYNLGPAPSFYKSMAGDADWLPEFLPGLDPLGGYWAYLNVAKEFGVVAAVVEGIN